MSIKKINLSDLRKEINRSFDLFICSSSFENRCLSIPQQINPDNIHQAFIVSHIDHIKHIQSNQRNLTNHFGDKSHLIEVSTSDPICTVDNLYEALRKEKAEEILIDVTAFTHESLLILLKLLRIQYPMARITGAYTNASEYSINEELNSKWLSRGIGDVRSVIGFPGNLSPSRKLHLILIVGYEYERAAGLIEALEPYSIALGYGRTGSATTITDTEANRHYMYLVKQMATSFLNIETFEIPCDDPYGTRDEIKIQIEKAQELNIVVAPMNNKLTTIGTAWAILDNNQVQMCYAQALLYNYANYSMPGDQCYLFSLDNSSINQVN